MKKLLVFLMLSVSLLLASVEIKPGWNLISVPVQTSDEFDLETLLNGKATIAWKFNTSSTGEYSWEQWTPGRSVKMKNGDGIFVGVPSGTSQLNFSILPESGTQNYITFDTQSYLKDKWYLVGFGYPMSVGDIKAIYPTSVVWIMENGVYKKLEDSTTIIPAGQGFWFKNKGERVSTSSSSSGSVVPGNSCTNQNISGAPSMIYDCAMQCVDATIATIYKGDLICDNGSYGYYLNCPAFSYDGGDCTVASSSSSSSISSFGWENIYIYDTNYDDSYILRKRIAIQNNNSEPLELINAELFYTGEDKIVESCGIQKYLYSVNSNQKNFYNYRTNTHGGYYCFEYEYVQFLRDNVNLSGFSCDYDTPLNGCEGYNDNLDYFLAVINSATQTIHPYETVYIDTPFGLLKENFTKEELSINLSAKLYFKHGQDDYQKQVDNISFHVGDVSWAYGSSNSSSSSYNSCPTGYYFDLNTGGCVPQNNSYSSNYSSSLSSSSSNPCGNGYYLDPDTGGCIPSSNSSSSSYSSSALPGSE